MINSKKLGNIISKNKIMQWSLELLYTGFFENDRKLVKFTKSLRNNGYTGWSDLLEYLIDQETLLSEKEVLRACRKYLNHKYDDINDFYQTLLLLVEYDLFDDLLNFKDDISDYDHIPITAGKDQTTIYFDLDGPVSSEWQRMCLAKLKNYNYYNMYHMTVTPEYIIINLAF